MIVRFLGRLAAVRGVNWIAAILAGIVGNIVGCYVWRAIRGGNDLIGHVCGVVAAALVIVGSTNATRRSA